EDRQRGALAVPGLEVERPDTVRGAGFVRVAVAVALRCPARLVAARPAGRDLDAGQEGAEEERIALEDVVEQAELVGGKRPRIAEVADRDAGVWRQPPGHHVLLVGRVVAYPERRASGRNRRAEQFRLLWDAALEEIALLARTAVDLLSETEAGAAGVTRRTR